MHKTHFKLNIIKLISNLNLVYLQINKSLGNIGIWLIGNSNLKRGSFNKGEVREVLPTPRLSLVDPEGFKGVDRDCGHWLIDVLFII